MASSLASLWCHSSNQVLSSLSFSFSFLFPSFPTYGMKNLPAAGDPSHNRFRVLSKSKSFPHTSRLCVVKRGPLRSKIAESRKELPPPSYHPGLSFFIRSLNIEMIRKIGLVKQRSGRSQQTQQSLLSPLLVFLDRPRSWRTVFGPFWLLLVPSCISLPHLPLAFIMALWL